MNITEINELDFENVLINFSTNQKVVVPSYLTLDDTEVPVTNNCFPWVESLHFDLICFQ